MFLTEFKTSAYSLSSSKCFNSCYSFSQPLAVSEKALARPPQSTYRARTIYSSVVASRFSLSILFSRLMASTLFLYLVFYINLDVQKIYNILHIYLNFIIRNLYIRITTNNCRYQWNLKKMTPVQYRDHLLSHLHRPWQGLLFKVLYLLFSLLISKYPIADK